MTKLMQYANFVLKFGEQELLDEFEIVSRAFLHDVRVRSYGKTHFHFLEPKLKLLDQTDPMSLAIFGRFVKDTVLERDQVLDGGLLRQSHDELRSSPSSYFVLMLASHRLVFLPETRFAPTLAQFAATTRKFLLDAHKDFIRDKFNVAQAAGEA